MFHMAHGRAHARIGAPGASDATRADFTPLGFFRPMPGHTPTSMLAAFLVVGVCLATPLASAFSMGVDADGVETMKSAGATPTYGQTWVGPWMRTSGWGSYDSDLAKMRDSGVTPVVMWYYWGDSISQNCVNYGCGGRSRGEWNAMATELGKRAASSLGSRSFLVVLEPEFNKNGISGWETFDGHLVEQARLIRAAAPNAKIVIGFGSWGGWDAFDRAVATSDHTGFQLMRATTRDSTTTALDAAQQIVDTSRTLQSRFGKSVVVFDLAIGTYGGWEWVQERVLRDIQTRRADIDAAGVRVIVWRYVDDNDLSSGYFGAAESSWGVRYDWGGKKPAFDELVTLIQGASSSSGSSTTTPTTSTTPSGAVFTGLGGNNWWIQTNVAGAPTKVEARLAGGAWSTLTKQSWGAYARSMSLPAGSTVELRATYGDGSVRTAASAWPPPSSTPGATSGTTTASTSTAAAFAATWSCVSAKNWWTQACVAASSGVASVDVRVNGGSWQPLTKQSWGGWARSFAISPGSKVEFRATSPAGEVAHSSTYWSS